jgi:hypothetical protein
MRKNGLSAPHKALFIKIMDEYHVKKKECLASDSCAGMNPAVFDGVFDRCGKMNPFEVWEKNLKDHDKKYQKDLDTFMDYYDIPPFEAPFTAIKTINAYF